MKRFYGGEIGLILVKEKVILLKATNPTNVMITILCTCFRYEAQPVAIFLKEIGSFINNGTRNAEYWNTRLFMLRLVDSRLIVKGKNESSYCGTLRFLQGI